MQRFGNLALNGNFDSRELWFRPCIRMHQSHPLHSPEKKQPICVDDTVTSSRASKAANIMNEREKIHTIYIYMQTKNVTAHIQAMLHCHHWLRMIHTCSATCSDVRPNLAKSRRFLFHSLKIEETSWHRGSSKMLGRRHISYNNLKY